VTARCACGVDLGDQVTVVSLSLREDADAWKITGFYVSPPTGYDP
jgi:hypothetical protein